MEPNTRLSEQLRQDGRWRQDFEQKLQALQDWLRVHELQDAAVDDWLGRLSRRLRSDKITVAFVAEFSRGKSELINALFFADYGRRIMPASAGRTTMCPTEIGYDAHLPPSLRLLPIQTRTLPFSLAELRGRPEQWTTLPLEPADGQHMADTLQKVSDTIRVDLETAESLGLWHPDARDQNPPTGEDGLVELPRWRHALINVPHPLLSQGLVVLDTPGLNAIGAEPELTVSTIPQCDAVVFMLAADTGVTQSDLTIWRDHLSTPDLNAGDRVVVLNKIDTLWGGLDARDEVDRQMQRQRDVVAAALGVPPNEVLAVSAQKGLLAKIQGDAQLLAQSQVNTLETLLADHLVKGRHERLHGLIREAMGQLQDQARARLNARHAELVDQGHELRGLVGKNSSVVRMSKMRVEAERQEFERAGSRIHAVKAVQLKLLQQVFQRLGGKSLSAQTDALANALSKSGIKLGLQREYVQLFDHLRTVISDAQAAVDELHTMLGAAFNQLNAELGLQLRVPDALSLEKHRIDLDRVEAAHLKYVKLGNSLALLRKDASVHLMRLLKSRLRMVFETAQTEVEMWSKKAASQLDGQLVERRRQFIRRVESIERVQQASGDLGERVQEVELAQIEVERQQAELEAMSRALLVS